MVTLDRLLAETGIEKVDVIKMDIQGAEALALRGMFRTLAYNPDLVIFTEFWPWGIEQTGLSPLGFLSDLQKEGFRFKAIDEDKHRVREVTDIDQFVAEHGKFQYTSSANLQRSHTNLLCTKGDRWNEAELLFQQRAPRLQGSPRALARNSEFVKI